MQPPPLFTLLALTIGIIPGHAAAVKYREGAVRGDKAAMENDARWIYNDVDRGFAEAKKAGKPLLVVLRCVPCLSCVGLDAEVLKEPVLSPLLDQFVCVRLINANAIDLARFQFDYDLSFSTLFFNADGTVYGRYGSWVHQADPEAKETIGYDSSETMLAKSSAFMAPGLRFECADINGTDLGRDVDLIFSNAALQWIPDHPHLFERLILALAKDGQLAVQMPANYDHPSHIVAIEVAREPPFKEALGGYTHRAGVLAVEEYSQLFHTLGLRESSVRLQVYGHVLASREEVFEWVKGTLLTDYQQRLSADLFARFVNVYRERLINQLEDKKPYFFAFKRVLLWARR